MLYLNNWPLPFGRHGLIIQISIPIYFSYRAIANSIEIKKTSPAKKPPSNKTQQLQPTLILIYL